jgi:hypothetical protein
MKWRFRSCAVGDSEMETDSIRLMADQSVHRAVDIRNRQSTEYRPYINLEAATAV